MNSPSNPISAVTDGIPSYPNAKSSWSPPIACPITSLLVPFKVPYGNGASIDIYASIGKIPGLLYSISFFCLPLNGYINAFPFEWKLIINANSALCLTKKSLKAYDSGSENGFGPG